MPGFQLCIFMLVGITTGQDIIKWLIRQGLTQEQTNPADRREKLISVTQQGQELLNVYQRKLTALPALPVDMDEETQRSLAAQREMLDNYHTRQYEAKNGIQ